MSGFFHFLIAKAQTSANIWAQIEQEVNRMPADQTLALVVWIAVLALVVNAAARPGTQRRKDAHAHDCPEQTGVSPVVQKTNGQLCCCDAECQTAIKDSSSEQSQQRFFLPVQKDRFEWLWNRQVMFFKPECDPLGFP